MNLEQIRTKIDELDKKLVDLLNQRTSLALEIGELKKAEDREIYVPSREQAVLKRVTEASSGPLSAAQLTHIYREIMSASLAIEHDLHIAYLGPEATYTHQAAISKFGSSVAYMPCDTIQDVFSSVAQRQAEYGVVPIENSTEGAVTHTLDEFIDAKVKICAEVYIEITHALLSRSEEKDIKHIYSNPQVFGQCRKWLHKHMSGVGLIPVASTAKAAETAAQEPGAGALASKLAAEIYELKILHDNIQDLGGNTTRFLVIGNTSSGKTGQDKTSICFSVNHEAGALQQGLAILSQYGLNMTKIESRPNKSKAWEYTFFVDIEGHEEDEQVAAAMKEMAGCCTLLRVLGSYPKFTSPLS